MIRFAFLLVIAMTTSSVVAAIPAMKFTPLGKAEAPVKGTFNVNFSAESENFSPISSSEYGSRRVFEKSNGERCRRSE